MYSAIPFRRSVSPPFHRRGSPQLKHSDFRISSFQVVDAWRISQFNRKTEKYFKRNAVTKLQTFVWIFNHVSRVITWSLFNFRAPNLSKKPISTWPFIWWCQFIDQFKFETSSSSLRNYESARGTMERGKRREPLFALSPSLRAPRALFFLLPSLPTTQRGLCGGERLTSHYISPRQYKRPPSPQFIGPSSC